MEQGRRAGLEVRTPLEPCLSDPGPVSPSHPCALFCARRATGFRQSREARLCCPETSLTLTVDSTVLESWAACGVQSKREPAVTLPEERALPTPETCVALSEHRALFRGDPGQRARCAWTQGPPHRNGSLDRHAHSRPRGAWRPRAGPFRMADWDAWQVTGPGRWASPQPLRRWPH